MFLNKNNIILRLISLVLSAFLLCSVLASCDVLQGPAGLNGADGSNGINGVDGEKGDPGEKGEDGNTPFIGENGNWWIGNTDTGIKASGTDGETGPKGDKGDRGETGPKGDQGEPGEKGEDGNTPFIGENGNWWIGDVDTGISASGNSSSIIENAQAEEIKELLTLKKELRVNEGGSFRVVVFSDIHFYSANELKASDTLKYINNIVDKENPDLVLFAGDNWWSLNTEEKFRAYVEVLVEHIEDKQIPWAHVYGNHDDEINYGGYYTSIHQSAQQRICEEFEYCVSKWGDEELSGVGNYVLPVLSYDGKRIAFNIWGLDSGSYANTLNSGNITDSFTLDGKTVNNTFYAKYEGIRENQVEWYVKTSKLLEEYNGAKIPAMMYFHIPLQETYTAWKLAAQYGKNGSVNQKYADMEIIGTKAEGVCAPAHNAGLFDEVVERGDVKLITYGHDHVSDFSVNYRGVNLCYVPTITTRSGVGGANHDLMGGRVIDFSATDGSINTYMSYVKEAVVTDSNAPIVDLNIADNGTVSNSAQAIGSLTYYETGTAVTVSKDTTINKNVITFAGHSTSPSVYNIPAAIYNNTFADGFSYEVMFKLTECNLASGNYVGILDYVEAGGWGLTVKNVNGSFKIFQETKVGSNYNNLMADFEVGKWYHVVYVFTGDSAALYVNGVKADSATGLTGGFVAPSFSSRSGEEYICIGGCSHAWQDSKKSNGIKGMTGSIAICTVLPNALTDAEALALYN